MLIKRFEAETMADALAQVKRELGPDAIVLSTRTLRRDAGVFGLFARPGVEVTAAMDRDQRAADNAPRAAQARVGADSSWRVLQASRSLIEPLEEEIRSLRAAIECRGSGEPTPAPSLADEVAELRRLARHLAERVPEPPAPESMARYRAAGLSLPLARDLAGAAEERVRDGMQRDEAEHHALASRIESRLVPPRTDVSHQLVVGAPGVGKTTTVAKELGWLADPRTRVVSTDVHRLGGAEGLRSAAKRLGVPFDVARSADALAQLAARRRARVLVDTPGRSRGDSDALADLALYRSALGAGAQVQVVLAATTKECDLRHQLARYRYLEPAALVVTKLDESLGLGNVMNVVLDESSPKLAWIGHGQRVPEDLSHPDPRALATRVLEAAA